MAFVTTKSVNARRAARMLTETGPAVPVTLRGNRTVTGNVTGTVTGTVTGRVLVLVSETATDREIGAEPVTLRLVTRSLDHGSETDPTKTLAGIGIDIESVEIQKKGERPCSVK